jgi:hypothetical protein
MLGKVEVTMIIAKRTLLLAPQDLPVEIVIRAPIQEEDGAWRCNVELTGLQCAPPPAAYGVDEIQAIEQAIQIVHALLPTLPEYKAGRLFHSDGSAYREP